MNIEVDTERLRSEAEALGSHAAWLRQADSELAAGCAAAKSACGHTADGGLPDALGKLQSAWSANVAGIEREVGAAANVMRSIARMYADQDQEGAAALD